MAAAREGHPAYPTHHTPKPAAVIAAKINPSDTSVSGFILGAMSLLHPPPGFPPHLCVIWPLIWVQVLVLRAAVRAAYGRGVQYHWSVTPCGRAYITSIDWIPSQKAEREWLKAPAHANARLAAALDGRAFVPAYARSKPLLLWACAGKRTHCVRDSSQAQGRGEYLHQSPDPGTHPKKIQPHPPSALTGAACAERTLTSHCCAMGPSSPAGGREVATRSSGKPLSLWERRGPPPKAVGGEGLPRRRLWTSPAGGTKLPP